MRAVPGKPTSYAGQYRRRPEPQTGGLPVELCSVDGCERPVQARGLCPRHYRRLMRTGTRSHGSPRPGPQKPPEAATRATGGPVKPDRACGLLLCMESSGLTLHASFSRLEAAALRRHLGCSRVGLALVPRGSSASHTNGLTIRVPLGPGRRPGRADRTTRRLGADRTPRPSG
jgi:hypothetical protein